MSNLLTPDGRVLSLPHGTLSVQPMCKDNRKKADEESVSNNELTYFHDEYDTWQFEKTAQRGIKFIEQEHIEVLGWYLLCSGDVICEVKDQEQGTEVIRRIFDVVSKGSTAISIDKSGDEISVSNYV